MAFAMVDADNRIIAWSEEPLDKMDTWFANGGYVDDLCVNGVRDFVIIDGMAVYDPLQEDDVPTETQPTNEEIMDAVIELAGIVSGMMEGSENG